MYIKCGVQLDKSSGANSLFRVYSEIKSCCNCRMLGWLEEAR